MMKNVHPYQNKPFKLLFLIFIMILALYPLEFFLCDSESTGKFSFGFNFSSEFRIGEKIVQNVDILFCCWILSCLNDSSIPAIISRMEGTICHCSCCVISPDLPSPKVSLLHGHFPLPSVYQHETPTFKWWEVLMLPFDISNIAMTRNKTLYVVWWFLSNASHHHQKFPERLTWTFLCRGDIFDLCPLQSNDRIMNDCCVE